jgi:hypothetical protein
MCDIRMAVSVSGLRAAHHFIQKLPGWGHSHSRLPCGERDEFLPFHILSGRGTSLMDNYHAVLESISDGGMARRVCRPLLPFACAANRAVSGKERMIFFTLRIAFERSLGKYDMSLKDRISTEQSPPTAARGHWAREAQRALPPRFPDQAISRPVHRRRPGRPRGADAAK